MNSPTPTEFSSSTWLSRFANLLNPKRSKYAWLMGAILWTAWLTSIFLGKGNYDLAGQPVGGDYVDFQAAGLTINLQQTDRLYDFDYQKMLQVQILGKEFSNPTAYNALITPPLFSVPFIALALLPFRLSFAIWSLIGLALTYLTIKLSGIERSREAFLWSLTWFPVFATISFGQNSLVSLGLFAIAFSLWNRKTGTQSANLCMAGAIASLLAYKPQLTFGLGLLWLFNIRRDWPALASMAMGGGIQAILSFWWMPQASRDYFSLAKDVLPTLLQQPGYPIWHSHNWRAFWLLVLPGQATVAETISTLLALGGIWFFFRFNQKFQPQPELRFAGAVILTLWISPHFLVYDWAILLLPALLYWNIFRDQQPILKALFAIVWLAIFVSGPLTVAQLKILPFALQLSMPVLTVFCIELWRMASALNQEMAFSRPD